MHKLIVMILMSLGWMLLVPRQEARAQQDIFVNLAPVDGLDLNPDNVFQFQIQSGMSRPTDALVSGTIRYRNQDLRISYRFRYRLQPGMNILDPSLIRPEFTYSGSALKELFEVYRRLPQGIYEYCVSVQTDYGLNGIEYIPGDPFMECLYRKSEDLFLINLADPENDAKLYELNPMLSWVVNYPFAAGLTYRLRVAEMKDGQPAASAVGRNNPVYEERNITGTSRVYPVHARPLKKFQPYAWTVDAYYKGMLLGGAEPWKFTIIEDSLLVQRGIEISWLDIAREKGSYSMFAPGKIRLQFELKDRRADTFELTLYDKKDRKVPLPQDKWAVQYGDNRLELVFREDKPLKHRQPYTLMLRSAASGSYVIPFTYANPLYLE